MSGLTNALVAQQVQALLDTQKRQTDYLTAWLGGSPTGGPNNDGRYPFVDLAGVEILVPAPATFNSMVSGPAALSVAAKAAAEFARDLALGHADRANDQRELAEAARGAAVDARNLAQEHRNHAGTHEANARYWAELAQGVGQTSTEDREIVEQLAEQVADNAALASQDADDAAASAALAATFDPALYDLKSETLAASRLTGVIDRARIPVLPSGRQFASTGGLPQLTSAQQAEIGEGSIVTTTDGMRYVYSGQGSKTVAASYTVLADITPDWDALANKPSFYPSNIANVAGLQSALDAKLSTGASITVTNVAFNTGLLYPDANHTVIKTGPGGSERYWRFDANGFLYALNGGFHAEQHIQTRSHFLAGNSSDGSRAELNKGWIELRNDSNGFGPYIDFSATASADYHGRIAWTGNKLNLYSSTDVILTGQSGKVQAYSSNGAQQGDVLTEAGGSQSVSKRIVFVGQGQANADFNSSNIAVALEVQSNGSGAAMMAFHRPSAHATYFGLGTDNQFRYGGWSAGQTSYRFWTEQNFNPLSFTGDTINAGVAGLSVTGAGGITVTSSGGIKSTGSGGFVGSNFQSVAGDGNGFRFWQNNIDFSISMGSSAWGGRAPGETTSDYNMYFRMSGGSNRGFVFKDGATSVAGIDSSGFLRTAQGANIGGNLEAGGSIYSGSGHWFRVRGSSGIYWEDFGGGWHMTDTSWLRAYNGKNIYTTGQVRGNTVVGESDIRLKQNVEPIIGATAKVASLNGVTFDWIKTGKPGMGFIAQDFETVLPALVTEDTDGMKGVEYGPVVALLVEALKETNARLDVLESGRV